MSVVLGLLALLSLVLNLWQWVAARRFPVHARTADRAHAPGVTLLKPLKGLDPDTDRCLRSWLAQDYPGPVQVLFGIPRADDPVRGLVARLQAEFPCVQAELVVCAEVLGTNQKVSTLVQLERRAAHDILVVSDADVAVPGDFLGEVVGPLRDPAVGLANPLYALANPVTPALRWEAVAVNADFWSQVLQARSLGPLDFALGAAMAVPRRWLDAIGGFGALADHLADDFELGHRIARAGGTIALVPVVAECWERPHGWRAVWAHQLRWARTIRACQPLKYAGHILSNATLWPLLWAVSHPTPPVLAAGAAALAVRVLTATDHYRRLARTPLGAVRFGYVWLKDILQAALWVLAFAGSTVEWRGARFRVQRDGRLVRC